MSITIPHSAGVSAGFFVRERVIRVGGRERGFARTREQVGRRV